MKHLLISVLTITAPLMVQAKGLQPAPGEKICVAREYSPAHMKAHPKQLLNKLVVIVENKENEQYGYVQARVMGEHKGRTWGNRGAGCSYKSDGTVFCGVDCDGGSFSLKPEAPDRTLLKITKDYYFPLYPPGVDTENSVPEETLSLEYKDRENRTYRTYSTDVNWCEREWKKWEATDHGC